MKKIISYIVIFASMFIISACAPKIQTVDYNQRSMLLSLGMSKNDVMQIVGTPRRTDVNQDRERWIYWNKAIYGYTVIDNENVATDRLVITFIGGKVTKWGQQSLADDIVENTQKIYQQAREKPQTVIIKNQ